MIVGRYRAAPTAVADGAGTEVLTDAVGRIQTSTESGQRVARTAHLASAALPAAGAFTTQAAYAVPLGIRWVMFYVTYARGAVGGQPQFVLEFGNGTETATDIVFSTTITPAQPFATQLLYMGQFPGPIPADGAAITFPIRADASGGATTMRLRAAEIGDAGSPGTCSISLTASG